jgi:hypothetical protein
LVGSDFWIKVDPYIDEYDEDGLISGFGESFFASYPLPEPRVDPQIARKEYLDSIDEKMNKYYKEEV